MAALSLVFLSCNKIYEDKIPPTIILQGPNPYRLFTSCSYSEPGYIIKDDLTPNSQIKVDIYDSTLNTTIPGDYYIDYYSTDLDGNTSYVRRKIETRKMTLDYFNSGFIAYDTLKPMNIKTQYSIKSVVYSQEFKWIRIENFNNFGKQFKVIMIPDTLGNLTLNYNFNDTIVFGTGNVYCNMTGFRLEYQIDVPENDIEMHYVTYRFLN